jgi:exodeoxyribonuclease V gamma subunit
MLRAVHGNRAESLLGALQEALPPADPFAPTTIVVGSHLVARWLSREIALARGIVAGLELVTFDSFLEKTWEIPALDRRQLAAAIASVLADDRAVARLPAVAHYLDAAPEGGDRAAPRRVQLAEHIADLAWQYMQTRPEWMGGLLDGRVPAELASDSRASWQWPLIAQAIARASGRVPVPMLPWARRRAGGKAPALPRPVFVFGVSFLQRAQVEALSDLAAASDVTVFVLDPCAELWDDLTPQDSLVLSQWGRALKGTLHALVERTGGDFDDAFIEAEPRDAREQLLADVLHRSPPQRPVSPAGVHVLACPDPRRELEVVAAQIRRHLDEDPTLSAHQIGVWIASDAERYLAQAPAALEAVGVPLHLIDAPLDDRGRIGEAVLALLELPTGTMSRRELLSVMTHPAVLAGHPHVDPDDWVRWTERLGIVHGADGDAHEGTYLEQHPGRFHWDQGVRRLALGAFMRGDQPAMIGQLEVIPEDVRPEQHASAATYALLVRSLCADTAWLAQHQATLTEWADVLVALVDGYIARDTDDAKRDVERVRSMLAGLAHLDLDGRRVGFREAREHAVHRLGTARKDRGEPLARGVMVAPLAAMRAFPFRVAFVLGLAEGAFPAGDQPSSLDVREAKPGDVTLRDRDRHAFLEVVLGARDALYLSYVAAEPKSGQVLGPSSVVLELADALAPYLGAASAREALEAISRRVPLHRWTDEVALPPAIAREQWAVRVREAMRAHLRSHGWAIPDEDGMHALLEHTPALRAALGLIDAPPPPPAVAARPVSLTTVRGFLESPIQAWAQAVLGLGELPDEEIKEHSDEPFDVDPPARAVVLREALAAHLRDPARDLASVYDAVVRDLELRGQFPVGVFGAAARGKDLRVLEQWRKELGPIEVGAVTRLAFGRSTARVADLRAAIPLELAPGRSVRLVGQTELLLREGDRYRSVVPLVGDGGKKSHYHLRGALDHLVLAAAELAPAGHAHILLDREGEALRVDHAPWSPAEARGFLADLVRELLDAPHGYVLPWDQLVRVLEDKAPEIDSDPNRALRFGPVRRLDGLDLPADAADIAERRLRPLVERMSGDSTIGEVKRR